MNIAKIRDEIGEMVREAKQGHLALMRDPHPDLGDTDIRNAVHGFRGEDPVVSLMPWQTDRDKTLEAAYYAAVAFGCDVLSFTTESWHPSPEHTEINPYNGKHWGEIERSMQKAVEEHNALAEGVITESLLTVVVNRAGDITALMQDYKVSHSTSVLGITSYQIEWAEPVVLDSLADDAVVSGLVPERLIAFMNIPTVQQQMLYSADRMGRQLMAELGPVKAQAHQDCATVKFLYGRQQFEGGIILLSNDPVRSEVIHESLGEGGFGFGVHHESPGDN